MAEFVTAKHEGIEGTARLATTAVERMKGWEIVEIPTPEPTLDPELPTTELDTTLAPASRTTRKDKS